MKPSGVNPLGGLFNLVKRNFTTVKSVMRLLLSLTILIALAVPSYTNANAATFNLPSAGEVEIVGNLPTPVTISVSMVATPLQGSYWAIDTSILQAGDIAGPFLAPQGCVGSVCGTLAGFYVCGGRIGCGITLPAGSVISRTGDPISFDVSDASRFLTINTSVTTDGVVDLQLTVALPDGLELQVINDPIPEGLAQTPLPATLPLFATGIGTLSLVAWRRKWKTCKRDSSRS